MYLQQLDEQDWNDQAKIQNVGKEEIHKFFLLQGERLLDEQGWREEAKGVIKEIINFVKVFSLADQLKYKYKYEYKYKQIFVKVFAVSDQLKASSTEIFLNLVTLEDSAFTIKLNERGFEVVGNSLDTNNTEG